MSEEKKSMLCWFDLYADNTERAKNFYGEMFNWTFQQFADHDMWMIEHKEGEIGGIIEKRKAPAPAGQSFLPYFPVPSVETFLKKAEKLGGKVTQQKTLISEHIGWYGVVEDTEKNRIALYQPVGK